MDGETKKQLIDLDKKIDSKIKEVPLLSMDRDLALFHLLVHFEDFGRLPKLDDRYSKNIIDYFSHIKYGQDGLHFAVLWVYKYCKNKPVEKLIISEDSTDYLEAAKLLEIAINYSVIWDFMASFFRERYYITQYKDDVVNFEAVDALNKDYDIADKLMRIYFDEIQGGRNIVPDQSSIRGMLIDLKVEDLGNGRIRYKITDELLDEVKKMMADMYQSRWDLDPSWSVGGYTIGDFRKFWVTLISLCYIHSGKCFFSGVSGMAINSVVKVRSRDRWVKELSSKSGLDKQIVDNIMDDLIFDMSLYDVEDNKDPDITYQPFFPINNDLLLLSSQLATLSNPERNLWDLINIKRPDIHSKLRNQKEGLWINKLESKLKKHSLRSFNRINFNFDNIYSDVDLLVLDEKDKFGIAFQLKWIIESDRIKDIEYFDRELIKGKEQVKFFNKWLEKVGVEGLGSIIDYNLDGFDVRGMVLSKNLIGSGIVHDGSTLIANEPLLDWILGDRKKSLRKFYKAIERESYFPVIGKHYKKVDIESEFGGIKFIGDNLGAEVLKTWSPKDIKFRFI